MTIRETVLPGIGHKFQLDARSGDKLVIIVHDDGRRDLYHFEADDPDEIISVVTLDDSEARQVAGLIGGMNYQPKALETIDVALNDLNIEWYKIDSPAYCIGRTIGEINVRQATGATIIAVIEPDNRKHVNPGPDYKFREKSLLVIVGERKQLKKLKEILLHGS
ncbi:cation:proton antiporter regulatory subunit|uniref:Potassium/proton antiporter regulatory subunit, CPA2 family n=1 Tax=Dendrosporobacter quercicolus TaxID=146817 RepID=A0A1G9SQ84_9FIRM|nr:cation:proton antiporter regulatory subunit [Dendrosporobacter quercicolus]NSL48649.1 cation:proton antiporter regulatory subunit [Dendrosporobacter quercicolus DSM 1736]SDM37618.1 potassium/proton antiporter regulatory subunit, CPA2 family [Dendrosporobacter quercicolus]